MGGVLLALATSLPQMTVDVHAARLGNPDLAVGDLMGSSLFNLLILAVADLLHRAPTGRMFTHSAVIRALSATASILLTALAGMAILVGGFAIGPGRVGLGSLAILCAYLFVLRLVYRDQRLDGAGRPNTPRDGWGKPLLGFSACAAVIFVAAPHLARAANTIAGRSGLGGTFIGTTLLALVTSLPELVATLTAVRIGAFALVAGNIFGSNTLNMVLLFPVELAHEGLLFHSISPVHAFTALAVVLITAVVVMGQLYRGESRRLFVEPDAVLVIVLVVGAQVTVYFLGDMSPARWQERRAEAERRAALAIAALAEVAAVADDERGTVVTLSGSVLFAGGKSELLPTATSRLTQVAQAWSRAIPTRPSSSRATRTRRGARISIRDCRRRERSRSSTSLSPGVFRPSASSPAAWAKLSPSATILRPRAEPTIGASRSS